MSEGSFEAQADPQASRRWGGPCRASPHAARVRGHGRGEHLGLATGNAEQCPPPATARRTRDREPSQRQPRNWTHSGEASVLLAFDNAETCFLPASWGMADSVLGAGTR